MSWGAITIGSLTLKETDILEDVTNANTGVRTVRFEGAETATGTLTQPDIAAKQADIMGLIDRTLPVVFQRKTEYNGYYRVTDTNTALEKWQQGPGQVRWSLAMEFAGPANAVDLESRLANVVRANDFSLAGERWHAPPVGHYGYYTGPTSPTQMVRQSTDGALTVYRGVPAGISPRWGCPVANYPLGRVRLLANGFERVSSGIPMAATGWELNNGLVRVKPAVSGVTSLLVAFWDGFEWRERAWDVRVEGDTLVPATHWDAITVMRLDPEVTALRVVARQPNNGARVLLDLLLRRGSRFVEGYVQRTAAGSLSVQLDVLEAWADNTTHASATVADANGIRHAAGSARFFSLATNGGVSLSSTTTLDFWIGAEVPGTPLGDQSNLDFQKGTIAGWKGNGVNTLTASTDRPKFGSFSGKLVMAGTVSPNMGVVATSPGSPGQKYLVSAWVNSTIATPDAFLNLIYRDAAGTFISDIAITATIPANVWTYVQGTATAAAGTVNMDWFAGILGSPANGTTLYVSRLMTRPVAPVSGDTAAEMAAQYIGAMAEKVGVVKR